MMVFQLLLPIFVVSTVFSQIKHANLSCKYTFEYFPYNEKILNCEAIGNLEFYNENIQINTLIKYYSFVDKEVFPFNIKGFIAKSKAVYSLPSKLGNIFPNLRVLIINHSNLKAISSENLKSLKHLNYLDLKSNEIEVLESYLFQHNINLKYICLSNNRIQYIYHAAFNDIHNLDWLDLTRNICYSFNSTTIQGLRNIQNKSFCSPELAETYREVNGRVSITNSNVIQWIVICALLLVIIILIQLIICFKKTQSDSERFKDESQNLYETKRNDYYSEILIESSTYEYIGQEIKFVEDVYSEVAVADYRTSELKIESDDSQNSVKMDDFYSEIYELNEN
ncbi:hypothetical protein ACKWTF_012927 [Chironomus riparius]